MGYHLNSLDEPVFIAVSKPLLSEFGIHLRLGSCEIYYKNCFHSSSLINDVCLVGKLSFRLGGGIKYMIINFLVAYL